MSTAPRPICFILMPFGVKPDALGRPVSFDVVYEEIYKPAVEALGLQPVRADEEQVGGIIHKPMFERLVLSPYAVADLTTGNPNVLYELGVRHAVRPRTTVLTFAQGRRLPFDVQPLRAVPYELSDAGKPADPAAAVRAVEARLREALASVEARDSPLYQLLDGYPDVSHEKTDVFRDQVEYSVEAKARLRAGRERGAADVRAAELDLGEVKHLEPGVAVDLMLSYRAVGAWEEMIRVVDLMDPILQRTPMVQEQLGFALNRAGRSPDAESVLRAVIDEHGASSETYGLLGRVYKDRWALKRDGPEGPALLRRAIDAYTKGFEADWRDAYPGINAVTLLYVSRGPEDDQLRQLLPVVRYSVERHMSGREADYWDYATLLELAVLSGDEQRARKLLGECRASMREAWEGETTARNLQLLLDARLQLELPAVWLEDLINGLTTA